MNDVRVDVAIIGGGVAAAAAALTLAGRVGSIAVIAPGASRLSERLSEAGAAGAAGAERDERVGESLSPSARAVLRELGVWPAFVDRVAAERRAGRANIAIEADASFSAWNTEFVVVKHASRDPGGAGWTLDRAGFEAFLWARVERAAAREGHASRCMHLDARFCAAAETAVGWRLQLTPSTMQGPGSLQTESVDARFVLDCSGRSARFARGHTEQRRYAVLTAAVAFLGQREGSASHPLGPVEPTAGTLVEACADGWWYTALLPSNRLALVLFSDDTVLGRTSRGAFKRDLEAWRRQVASAPFTSRRVSTGEFAITAPPRFADAGARGLERVAGRRWAAAGDAAAAFDPIASHGMTVALWSGRKAALAAAADLAGDSAPLARYADTTVQSAAGVREQTRSMYAHVRRFADAPFWQSRG